MLDEAQFLWICSVPLPGQLMGHYHIAVQFDLIFEIEFDIRHKTSPLSFFVWTAVIHRPERGLFCEGRSQSQFSSCILHPVLAGTHSIRVLWRRLLWSVFCGHLRTNSFILSRACQALAYYTGSQNMTVFFISSNGLSMAFVLPPFSFICA